MYLCTSKWSRCPRKSKSDGVQEEKSTSMNMLLRRLHPLAIFIFHHTNNWEPGWEGQRSNRLAPSNYNPNLEFELRGQISTLWAAQSRTLSDSASIC